MSAHVPNPPPTHRATPGKPYALLALLQVHWFIRLRWLFAAGALTALAAERFIVPTARRPAALLAVVLAVAAINVVWVLVARLLRPRLEDPGADQRVAIRHGQLFVGAQIAIDLLLLTWILALTGGVENPMALFYLFHMAISGLLLRTWQAALQGLWAVLLYSAMAVAQAGGWLTYYPFMAQLPRTGLFTVPTYVALVITVNALAVLGTLYFTDRIGRVLNRREDVLIRTNVALEQARQAIQLLQERRSHFMQTAARQLRQPLETVRTLAKLVCDGTVRDPPSVRGTCDRIAEQCRAGVNQVAALLTLTRVQDADSRRQRDARADVSRIVRELCAKHAPIASAKGVTLKCVGSTEGGLTAQVQPPDLCDCLGHLIENALKYTPAGGHVEVRVLRGAAGPPCDARALGAGRVASPRVEDFIHVAVADTGIGFGEDVDARGMAATGSGSLFDAFRRGDEALAAGIPGSGLGLTIVRAVVEQAGGYIHVESRPGQGATLTVSLPAAPDNPQPP